MPQTHDIRKNYYDEGTSLTQISRETGFDRKTVRKYIEKENWNLEGFIQESPSIIEPYKPLIDQWLENDKYQRRKQRHTARRIYQRLLEEADGFDASYRTVSNYVKKARHRIYQSSRGYLPLQHIPGEAQVDFGEADFIENGRRFSGAYLVLSLPYSNAGFLQVFGGQTYECLAEGMKAIFEHLGGVPTRIWFDNASSMVSSILKEGERILTDSFSRFINHYGFEAVFCNPNAGNEKGNVENKVGYLRRNYLVPIPEFADIREYNRLMLEQCNQDMQRLHYDKKQLINDLYILSPRIRTENIAGFS
jgi:transposase